MILTNYTSTEVTIKDEKGKIVLEQHESVPDSLIDRINKEMTAVERQTVMWVLKDERIKP